MVGVCPLLMLGGVDQLVDPCDRMFRPKCIPMFGARVRNMNVSRTPDVSVRPASSGRGRPAGANPPEADLGGDEAMEPQEVEDACSDRTRPRTLYTLP
jgi:hypothetical protein